MNIIDSLRWCAVLNSVAIVLLVVWLGLWFTPSKGRHRR